MMISIMATFRASLDDMIDATRRQSQALNIYDFFNYASSR